jgi:hypothetical protein
LALEKLLLPALHISDRESMSFKPLRHRSLAPLGR